MLFLRRKPLFQIYKSYLPWCSPQGQSLDLATPGSRWPLEFAMITVPPDRVCGRLHEKLGTSQFFSDLGRKADSYWLAVKFFDMETGLRDALWNFTFDWRLTDNEVSFELMSAGYIDVELKVDFVFQLIYLCTFSILI